MQLLLVSSGGMVHAFVGFLAGAYVCLFSLVQVGKQVQKGMKDEGMVNGP